MFNRLLALLLFILFCPLYLVIALIIFIEDGSPVLFRQKRVAKGYGFFQLYKFRTMRKDTPNVATHLLHNPGAYILRSGRILRKLSLDEFPNLINIIKGEMAFVGPRPALYNQDDLMKLRVSAGVHMMKPGITGWAQVNGRDEISIEEKVRLEKEYLDKKSVKMDLIIVIKTFFNVLSHKGVTH